MDNYSQSPTSYRAFLKQNGQKMLDEVNTQLAQTQQQPSPADQGQQFVSSIQAMQPQAQPAQTSGQSAQMQSQLPQQQSILGKAGPITEHFGDINPIEHYSHGFTNGIGIGVPDNTPVATPPGQWKVVESFTNAKSGGQGDAEQGINRGYGNSVLAQNTQTGEKLRFSHLTMNAAQPGMVIPGGTVFGTTGHTGNTTGPHLNLEYYNPQGQIADPLKSQYAQFLNLVAGGAPKSTSKSKGGGNPILNYLQNAAGNVYKGYTESPQAYQNNTQAGLGETIGNEATIGSSGLSKLGGMAMKEGSSLLGQMGHATPMLGMLSLANNRIAMPVKTGLKDAFDDRQPMANALKRYDTTLGDMAPVQPKLDINLYPDLLHHWQTIYGANNRNPIPQSMSDLAEQVRDGLRGALNQNRQGTLTSGQ